MKISFFIGGMNRGGAERVISILANHYARKGWEVDIVLLLYPEVQYELNEDIRIVDLSNGKGSYYQKLPKWLKQIRSYLKKSKPDRVVSFIGRINMLVLTAALGLKIPIVVSERNDPKHDGRGKMVQTYCNLIYKHAKAIVYQTAYEKSCFSRSLTQGVIIPNPVTVYAEAKPRERMEIVTAGRLMPQKNQKMLIDAFVEVKKSYPECMLKIYGEGALKGELQKQIDKLGLNDSAQLCGNVLDLHKRIAGAAVFALTSEFEGLSNALIEAMMLGLPCITTDYPGADELIQDNVNGLVVPRGNVNALAESLKDIIADHRKSEIFRENCLKSAQNYKMDIVLKQWEDVIEKDYGGR